MSERKVLNKYYPPDFDPTKIPRLRLPKTRQYTVRVMTPCNMRCNTCGDYIAKAKKFNARKETAEDETYIGLKIFRFYFKCPTCMAEITFKTDPKNCDYVVEHGATRNFQALRMAELQAQQEEKDKEEDEKLNPMKMLENRTKASRMEMEQLEALEELKEMNTRQGGLVDHEDILERKQKEAEESLKRMEEEDEAFVKKIFSQPGKLLSDDTSSDEDELPKSGMSFFNKKDTGELPPDALGEGKSDGGATSSYKRKISALIKVKRKDDSTENRSMKIQEKKPRLICAYSDSDSDS